ARPMSQAEPKWEYCEIVWYHSQTRSTRKRDSSWESFFIAITLSTPDTYYDSFFWAKGIGPQGVFDASEAFLGAAEVGVYPPNQSDAENRQAVEALVARLVQE